MIPQSPSHQAFVRIGQLQANTSLMLQSTTHSLSSMNHSKRKNTVHATSSMMLRTTVNKNTKQKKATTTITITDSLKSLQALDLTEVMDVLAASEDAASGVEALSVAEEHPEFVTSAGDEAIT